MIGNGFAKAIISWSSICYPKPRMVWVLEVGSWNKACFLRNLWNIYMQAGSVWVAWFTCYVLKNSSLEQVNVKPSCSWNCKKILNLRPLFFTYIDCITGECKLNGGRFSVSSTCLPGKRLDHRI